MTHLDEEKLGAWIDGALDDGEARGVEEHLRGCFECRRLESELRLFHEALGNLPGGGGRERAARETMAAWRGEVQGEERFQKWGERGFGWRRLVMGTVAAGLLLGLLLGHAASPLMMPGAGDGPLFAMGNGSVSVGSEDAYLQDFFMEEDL